MSVKTLVQWHATLKEVDWQRDWKLLLTAPPVLHFKTLDRRSDQRQKPKKRTQLIDSNQLRPPLLFVPDKQMNRELLSVKTLVQWRVTLKEVEWQRDWKLLLTAPPVLHFKTLDRRSDQRQKPAKRTPLIDSNQLRPFTFRS